MTLWQGAWHIAKHEMVRDRYGLLFTLGFSIYMALITFVLIGPSKEVPFAATWLLDSAFIITFPTLAYVMNRTMFRVWREDTYTDKLAEWRSMPIPIHALTLGRMIQLVLTLAPATLIFFILQYVFSGYIAANVSIAAFALNGLFWFFYGLAFAVTYVYYELGHSGMAFTIYSYLVLPILAVAVVIVKLVTKQSIVLEVLNGTNEGRWWYTAAALLICCASLIAGYYAINRRLTRRSYINKSKLKGA
ncbi:hypothetical protein [Paenibacillus sp. NPDC058071]|uniref:hypothetical protein n=1 Tax=Paenibacillus sp. NPDC058071 TaxID=3346326 RepID=UPI0036DA4D8B